jgi:transcriptional regulator with XRE-family HTH domain
MKKLREYIETELRSGTSQVALAKKMGVSPGSIYKWLNTDTVPDLATLKKVAERIGKNVTYFMEGEGRREAAHIEVYDTAEQGLLNLYKQARIIDPVAAEEIRSFAAYTVDRLKRGARAHSKGKEGEIRKRGEAAEEGSEAGKDRHRNR